jgi:hypothetical protein
MKKISQYLRILGGLIHKRDNGKEKEKCSLFLFLLSARTNEVPLYLAADSS